MENVLHEMNRETRFGPKEALFCRVISFYGRARMPAAFLVPPDHRSFNSLLHDAVTSRASDRCARARGSCSTKCEAKGLLRPFLLSALSALCANSMLDEAFRVKETTVTEYNVKPNAYIYTPLIKGLCKSGELDLLRFS
ncbi:hypothetical protein BHE74_00048579 [Ensete ventricosum]|nr:hypothetical protein BHE74_00048579 [Ensete ventricosum]